MGPDGSVRRIPANPPHGRVAQHPLFSRNCSECACFGLEQSEATVKKLYNSSKTSLRNIFFLSVTVCLFSLTLPLPSAAERVPKFFLARKESAPLLQPQFPLVLLLLSCPTLSLVPGEPVTPLLSSYKLAAQISLWSLLGPPRVFVPA